MFKQLTIGNCYAGAVDAFGYASNILGGGKYKVLWQIEVKREAHKYLRKNHPDTRKFYYDEWFNQYDLEKVDIITGGDPCQPSSSAGLRLGQADDRYRWPHMFSLIRSMRPNWVINENVVGSVSNLVLDQKITDLESIGYTAQSYIIPAVACNAIHRRDRVFLVANANVQGWREPLCADPAFSFNQGRAADTLGPQGNAFLQFAERMGEPAIFPVDDGIPDHIFRLGAAGNSIFSAIPIILLEAIYHIELIKTNNYGST